MQTEYVAGFLFTKRLSGVALIRKAHPAWQAGKLNGIGGKIEEGEAPYQAMKREFLEEAGLVISACLWMPFARLNCETGLVHWFWAVNTADEEIHTTTDEEVGWYSVDDVVTGKLDSVIPNLRWLIPMALNDIRRQDNCSLFDVHETELYEPTVRAVAKPSLLRPAVRPPPFDPTRPIQPRGPRGGA